MKSLCITGVPGTDFDSVSALLFDSGLAPARSVVRESTITFGDWHARVAPALARQQAPGRLWDQLAGDLLLANLHQPQWGWADPASVSALEFWAELEPGLNFLLLTSEPQDYLAHCLLHSNDSDDVDEAACLQHWQTLNEQLLAFYLEHSERCVLVEARQASANPKALAETLAERCGLELDLARAQLPALAQEPRQAAPHALARYVAHRATAEQASKLKPLHDELQAARLPLAEPEQQEDEEGNLLGSVNLSLASILKDYQRRCAQDLTTSEREALEQLKQQNQRLLDQFQQVQQQLQQVQEEKSAALLQHQQSDQARAELAQASQQHEEAKQENELLLLQLHQVQEELEATFLKQQESSKALAESDQAAKRAAEERDQARSERQRDAQQLEEAKQENELLLLQLHQVQEELEHYFLQHQQLSKQHDELQGEQRKLKYQLRMARQRAQQGGDDLAAWLDYEDVELIKEQVNPDYEHLWIKLKAPIFGETDADEWHFRLSCAGVTSDQFGQQPKLELPEQQEQLLQHWFVESESDHGRKLELRFALPNAMDLGVWQQIQSQDQALIGELLQRLPAMLEALQAQGCHIARDWADWQQLVADMQRIHHANTR
ncbi:MAG: hypothetical protein ACQEUN_16685 [Pseudomonadota bacterium]